ncbi:MAG: hypothetical protein CVV64_03250 [Candidatus Wallbacteria bacterium HGW-Wallbacteria-1]|jgi:hypothetical protein|uniref:SbsA Ig-like domain-containing protein n=1 Tax=Candidatus Wallbacteria bacterium HGW-Wallbacteria-1 TaxID=2013854 RepID=A0A2N1PTM0_9BACT|nr:MAG: hypothetical protein CVV64_03250 [Candidatus Wallbacteria bacterium HGW-Wallbacteria-1]
MRSSRLLTLLVISATLIFSATGCIKPFFDLEDETISKPSYLTLDNKVKEVQPTDKSTSVTVGSGIFITFNRPMDRESSQANFSLSPHLPGVFSWPTDSVMKYSPDSNLKHDTTYTIKVNQKAKDVLGNDMAASFESTFSTPIKAPEVFSTYPTTNEQNVPLNANIYINFSEPVNKTDSANAFTISPSLIGDFSWDDDDTMKFDPQQNLDQSTIYTVTISTVVKDIAGTAMVNPYIFSFKTALLTESQRPYIVSRVPMDETELKIEFSEKITKASAEAKENFTFDHGLGVLRTELRSDEKTVHVFTLPQVEGVAYQVSVRNIQDMAGNTIDSATAFFSYIAIDPPDVISSVALSGTSIQIVFSEALGSSSASEVDNYFITPFLDVKGASLTTTDRVQLTTSGQTESQLYEVRVSNIADVHGNKINKNSSAFFYGVK